jgi:4-amino-4-deoxychorismate lyase
MYLFLESIKILEEKISLLPYHQRRIDATIFSFYGEKKHPILLEKIFQNAINKGFFPKSKTQIYKCRLQYNLNDFNLEFLPYEKKQIENLKISEVQNDFDYGLKYLNREKLNALIIDNQEVLIQRNNLITDTSYANVAFLKDKKWWTPAEPLLEGTRRSFLLDEKIIFEKEIKSDEIDDFEKIKIFNAMINWEDSIELDLQKEKAIRFL